MHRRSLIDDFICLYCVTWGQRPGCMVLILLWSWILVNFVSNLRVNLISNTFKVIHGYQAEQSVLPRHGLLLTSWGIYRTPVDGCRTFIVLLNHERRCEVTRREVVITTCGRCLAAWSSHPIPCALLFVPLVCHQLLFILVGGDPLLRHDRVVWVVQLVQVIHAVLHYATRVILDCFKLLLKVLVGHDIIVSAQRLDDLFSILVHCDWFA